MKRLFVIIILSILLFDLVSFAEKAEKEDKYFFLAWLDCVTFLARPIKRNLKENNIDLNFFTGVLQGYDNNVNLNPSRDKDGFLQTSLDTEFFYNYNDDLRLRVENNTTNILYYMYTDANLFDNYSVAGFEIDFCDDAFMIGSSYGFDLVLFPYDEDGTYLGNEINAFLKIYITENIYHTTKYKLLYKYFMESKARDSNAVKTDDLRKDLRNIIEHEAGIYFKKAIIKLTNQIYHNDSNDDYYDYYDYWAYKIKPYFLYMFTKKLYTIFTFSYQQKRYAQRLSTDNNETVHDETFSINTSLLYELTPSFTLTISHSYRENISNEPLQKYSGSTFTAGLYYTF